MPHPGDRRRGRKRSHAAGGYSVHKSPTPGGRRTWTGTITSRATPTGIPIIGRVIGEPNHARPVGVHDVDFAVAPDI